MVTKESKYTSRRDCDNPPPYNPEWLQQTEAGTSFAQIPPPYNPDYRGGEQCDSFRSTTSAPARLDPFISSIFKDGEFPLFPYEYDFPPFVQAIPIGPATTTPRPEYNDSSITMDAVPPRIEHVFIGDRPQPSNAPPRFVPSSKTMARGSECHWKQYARKLACKTYWVSKVAVKKMVQISKDRVAPKAKQIAVRSAGLAKETTHRSFRFVQQASRRSVHIVTGFNETHQVVPKAQRAAQVVGREVKQASVSTIKGIRNLKKKHHLWSKSQRSLTQGARAVKDYWGKAEWRRESF